MVRADEWRLRMTENVNSVLNKLKGGADSAAQRFTRTQDRINQSVGRGVQGIRSGLSSAWKAAGSSASEYKRNIIDALPVSNALGSAMHAVTGPLGIAVALAGALALGIGSGVQAAERLGVPFRELRNLNLDKTDAQIDQLKGRILDLAGTEGLDAAVLTKGIYDAQSTTGKFGPEVENMVARIGVASRTLNMDFSTAVEGMSKALVQFKMPLNELDKLIESNAKTVQVGVVTYDQLAKVQTEYAGAAASANQQLDAANKVFTLLTVNTKNADIAATYAKAAFIDLGRGDTTKAFRKLGVDVFDANGHMRQADEILRDLVPELGKMSDLTYSQFKEEMGGTEGINALLDYAKASGSEVLRVLNDFDNSKFNVQDAIRKANGDLDVMKEKLRNQVTTALTRVGVMFMPMVTGIVSGLADVVGWLNSGIDAARGIVGWVRTMYQEFALVRAVVETVGATIASVWDATVAAVKGALNVIIAPIKAIAQALTGDFSGAWDTLKNGLGDAWDAVKTGAANVGQNFREAFNNTIEAPEVVAKAKLDTSGVPKEMSGLTARIMPQVMAPVLPGQSEALMSVKAMPAAPEAAAKPTTSDPYAGKFGKHKGKQDSASEGIKGVSGAGQQRSVTVNIQSLVKQVVIHTNNVRNGGADLVREVEAALIQAVQGTEAAIANE